MALDRATQRAIADALPIPVMIADADGAVVFLNESWYRYTGQTAFERDTDVAWRRYIHPDDRERVASEWRAAVRAGDDVVEMQYRLKEGSTGNYRWFLARAGALRDESGKIVRWLVTAMDIDDERRARAELSMLYDGARVVAATFQQASLPPGLPEIRGLRFDALYTPSEARMTIGGDWYDAFSLHDGSIAVAIGDVTGHGVEAAILMGKLRYSMRAIALSESRTGSIASILLSVEDSLLSEHPEASATAFLGIISADRTKLRYASAGHPPPLLLKSAKTSWLEGTGTPLGWRFDQIRRDRVVDLTGVSCLFLYTDGLIEAGRDILAGMERLRRTFEALGSRNRDDFARAIVDEALASLSPHDDIAALAVSFAE